MPRPHSILKYSIPAIVLFAMIAALAAADDDRPAPPPVDPEINRLRTAIAEARRDGRHQDEGEALQALADLQFRKGNFELSRALLERAVKVYAEMKAYARVASCWVMMANAYTRQSRPAEALALLERARTLNREIGWALGEAHVLVNEAQVHQGRDDYRSAIKATREALDILLRELPEWPQARQGLEIAYGNLGNYHRQLGEFDTALQFLYESLKLKQKSGNRLGEMVTLGSIGTVYSNRGEYAAAERLLVRSLLLAGELGDLQGIADGHNDLGTLYLAVGDTSLAREHFEKALPIFTRLGLDIGIATIRGNLGLLYSTSGESGKAHEACRQALAAARRAENGRQVTLHETNLIAICLDAGRLSEAKSLGRSALERCRRQGDTYGEAHATYLVALVRHAEGKQEEADLCFDRALEIVESGGYPEMEAKILSRRSRLCLQAGRTEDALRYSRRAMEIVPRLLSGLPPDFGISGREAWFGLTEVATRAAAKLGRSEDLHWCLEAGRAGALLEALGGRRALEGDLLPEAQHEELTAARRGVQLAIEGHRIAAASGDPAALIGSRQDLDQALRKLEEVNGKLRQAGGVFDLLTPDLISLESLRKLLSPDEAFVSYVVLSDVSLALVATRESARIVDLGASTRIVDAFLELEAGNRKKSNDAPLREITAALISPLDLKSGIRRVLLSPHSVSAFLPFSLLFGEREVSCVPSGTVLGRLRSGYHSRGKRVLAFGAPGVGSKRPRPSRPLSLLRWTPDLRPLDWAERELRAVGDETVLGANATVARLRSVLGSRSRWRAVHLSCHGHLDPDRPGLSALVLSPSGASDRYLTAAEVIRMRVPADLVVLSACGTAAGDLYLSEGVVGLTNAFMHAGASRVIVSLWPVDDKATMVLMKKFYALWNPRDGSAGMSAAKALRLAQEHVRSHPGWADPFYWAAWVLWGLPE